LDSGELARLQIAVERDTARDAERAEIKRLGTRLLAIYSQIAASLRPKLMAVNRLIVPLQPCIRDIWHDHVLFDGDQVTGFVDFGAVRIESVAGDVARLLDSLVADDPAAWRAGLAAYQSIRRLTADELTLVPVFRASGILLAGINWLEWLFVEGRQFENVAEI